METNQVAIKGRQPASIFIPGEFDMEIHIKPICEYDNGGAIGESLLPWPQKLMRTSISHRYNAEVIHETAPISKEAWDNLPTGRDQIIDWG